MIRISIVTPSFNQGTFIDQTIQSVIAQNYSNIEYIIIDGGSTDNTINTIKKNEFGISYWESNPDLGQSHALKKGFDISTGDIMCWINSDDYYEPETFKRVAKFFISNPSVSFVVGDINLIDKDGNILKRVYSIKPDWEIAVNLGQYRWPQPGCFWRRSHYFSVGGINSKFQFSMDQDLFIRLVKDGQAKRISGKPLANFRVHSESKSSLIPETGHSEWDEIVSAYGTKPKLFKLLILKVKWWLNFCYALFRNIVNSSFNIEL